MTRPVTLLAGAVLATWSVPNGAQADCIASPGQTHSALVTLSPAAGILCLMTVTVFAGPSCGADGATPEWTADLGCNYTSRMAVTDHGRLISILAPRAARLDWAIVAVTSRHPNPRHRFDRSTEVRLTLADLLGSSAARTGRLRVPHRVTIEGGSLRSDGTPPVSLTFEAVEALADSPRAHPSTARTVSSSE